MTNNTFKFNFLKYEYQMVLSPDIYPEFQRLQKYILYERFNSFSCLGFYTNKIINNFRDDYE